MPKLKTHSGAKKRFKRKPNGQIKHRAAFRSHILTKMSSKRKRQLRALRNVCDSDQKAVDRLLTGS